MMNKLNYIKKFQTREEQMFFEKLFNKKKYNYINNFYFTRIPDKKLIQSIFDYICDEVVKNDYGKIKKLPVGFQYIYAIWLLELEVNNGGFNQFFYNSSGKFSDEAYNGCVAIGAYKTAEIMKKAINIMIEEKELQLDAKKKGTVKEFIDSYKETRLEECDVAFFKYSENLKDLQINYVRKNYKDFQLNIIT